MNPRNINELLAALRVARDVRDMCAAELKQADNAVDAVEQELFAALNAAGGLNGATGSGLTVSVVTSIVPNVRNWDEFERYVHRHKAFHLFERRVHTKAWREETDHLKEPVPGTEPYERKRLNVRQND